MRPLPDSALDWNRVMNNLGLQKGEEGPRRSIHTLQILICVLCVLSETISALQAFRKRNSDAKAQSQAAKDMKATVRPIQACCSL